MPPLTDEPHWQSQSQNSTPTIMLSTLAGLNTTSEPRVNHPPGSPISSVSSWCPPALTYGSRNLNSSTEHTANCLPKPPPQVASPAHLYGVSKTVYCVHPDAINRYDHRPTKSKENTLVTIPPLTLSFEDDRLPAEWTAQVHPEGQLYFYKNIESRHYITQAHLRDNDELTEINQFYWAMETRLNNETKKLPEKIEIVLQLFPEWEGWGYYMIDHSTHSIFWLEEPNLYWAIGEEFHGIQHISHMKYWIESSYWKHWDLFPPEFLIPNEPVNRLRASFLHGNIDLITSLDSTMTMDPEKIRSVIDMIKHIDAIREIQDPICNQHINAAIGRILWFQALTRFHNFHGQHGARLGCETSVFDGGRKRRTILIRIVSPLLFNLPHTHLQQLEKLWVDNLVFGNRWGRHVKILKNEWRELVICVVLFLNVDVVFLVAASLFPGASITQNAPGTPSPSQICNMLSIIFSIGCLVFSLILYRHHPQGAECAEFAASYMSKNMSKRFGLELLSIMYSLPYALFLWAVTTLICAIALLCFYKMQNQPQRIATTLVWCILAIVFIWVIYRNQRSGGNNSYFPFYDNTPLVQARTCEGEFNEKEAQEHGISAAESVGASESAEEARRRGTGIFKLPDFLHVVRGLPRSRRDQSENDAENDSAQAYV